MNYGASRGTQRDTAVINAGDISYAGCWRRQISVDGVWMCSTKIRDDGLLLPVSGMAALSGICVCGQAAPQPERQNPWVE